MMSFTQDIEKMLTQNFGNSISSLIKDNYSDDNPKEIYALASNMLSKLMGEKNAKKKLSSIINKYPKIKVN